MAENKVTSAIKNNHLRLYIDGVLHLSLKADDVVGVLSYRSGGYMHIDYYVGEACIESTYKASSVWIAVLAELEKVEII